VPVHTFMAASESNDAKTHGHVFGAWWWDVSKRTPFRQLRLRWPVYWVFHTYCLSYWIKDEHGEWRRIA
jgi:hypothetical protein